MRAEDSSAPPRSRRAEAGRLEKGAGWHPHPFLVGGYDLADVD